MRIQTRFKTIVRALRSGAGHSEEGMALLVSMIALSVFSLVGMYMSFNAMTDLRISDNYETQIQARYAAQAGLSHARELLPGLYFDDLLKGPDGTNSTNSSYLSQARLVPYRNPLPWTGGRSVSIGNPAAAFAGIADDGVISTGKVGTTNGTPLIPLTGIAQTIPNPNGTGTVTLSRYFVRVADNNGEASELAADGADNPFLDGDNIIVVRSMGVAQTIREGSGANIRANSVAVFEGRFKRRTTFDLDAPVVLQGNNILPSSPNIFDGNAFSIDGRPNKFGIATIDTQPGQGTPLPTQLANNLAVNQRNNIRGLGGVPSIADVTGTVAADPDKQLLLSPQYMYDFATKIIPSVADSVFTTSQTWSGGSAPDLGSYDISKPYNDPSQRPRITYVDGNVNISGNLSGGGVLVVRGALKGSGRFDFNGLILVIGEGDVNMSGMNLGINGGLYIVNVKDVNGVPVFGDPKFTISGNSDIKVNSQAMRMGVSMLPPAQLSWREVTSMTDP